MLSILALTEVFLSETCGRVKCSLGPSLSELYDLPRYASQLTGPKPKGIKVETFRIDYLIRTPKVEKLSLQPIRQRACLLVLFLLPICSLRKGRQGSSEISSLGGLLQRTHAIPD